MGGLSSIPSTTKKKNVSVVKENYDAKDSFQNKSAILKTATKVQDTRNSTEEDSGKMVAGKRDCWESVLAWQQLSWQSLFCAYYF